MSDQKYNGWTNYETWNVALWIDNERGSQSAAQEAAQDEWDKADGSDGPLERLAHARLCLADRLQGEYEDVMADILDRAGAACSVWADLLGAALSDVDWREIADHYLVEVVPDELAQALRMRDGRLQWEHT